MEFVAAWVFRDKKIRTLLPSFQWVSVFDTYSMSSSGAGIFVPFLKASDYFFHGDVFGDLSGIVGFGQKFL
eukprot:scaffold11034_cov32-Attheya_sp.AAC.5